LNASQELVPGHREMEGHSPIQTMTQSLQVRLPVTYLCISFCGLH